ncbi:hypothetical protein [Dickeya ananatis]
MNLSVNSITGYSQPQSQTTTPSGTNTEQRDPITGKIITIPTSIKVSEETLARWRQASSSSNTLSKEEQEKLTRAIRDLRNEALSRTSSGVSLDNPLFLDPVTASDGLTFSSWANNLKADSDISKEDLLTLVHNVLAYGFTEQQSDTTSAMQLSVKKSRADRYQRQVPEQRLPTAGSGSYRRICQPENRGTRHHQ